MLVTGVQTKEIAEVWELLYALTLLWLQLLEKSVTMQAPVQREPNCPFSEITVKGCHLLKD